MKKLFLVKGIIILLATIAFTVCLTKVDVKPIGPNNTSVGLSAINQKFRMDYNETYYKISKYLGYAALLIPVVYAGIGVYQLITRKSFKKVDKKLYYLAIFYVVVLATYILFEKVVINYRPVMLNGELEASFPSSHTLMSLCFAISAILINRNIFKDTTLMAVINTTLFILGASVMVFRFISGVHWFTDIVGATLYALSYLSIFKAFVKEFKM